MSDVKVLADIADSFKEKQETPGCIDLVKGLQVSSSGEYSVKIAQVLHSLSHYNFESLNSVVKSILVDMVKAGDMKNVANLAPLAESIGDSDIPSDELLALIQNLDENYQARLNPFLKTPKFEKKPADNQVPAENGTLPDIKPRKGPVTPWTDKNGFCLAAKNSKLIHDAPTIVDLSKIKVISTEEIKSHGKFLPVCNSTDHVYDRKTIRSLMKGAVTDKGSAELTKHINSFYCNSPFCEEYNDSIEKIHSSAMAGDVESMLRMAYVLTWRYHWLREDYLENSEAAILWLEEAVRHGSEEAGYWLMVLCHCGMYDLWGCSSHGRHPYVAGDFPDGPSF